MERRAEESKTDSLGANTNLQKQIFALIWRRQQPEVKLPHHAGKVTEQSPFESVSGCMSCQWNCVTSIWGGIIFFLSHRLIQPHQQLQTARSSAVDSARSEEIRLLLDNVNYVRISAAAFGFAKICIWKGAPSNKITIFCVHKNGCRTSKWTSAHFWGGACSSMPVYNCRGRGGRIFVCKLSLIRNLVC